MSSRSSEVRAEIKDSGSALQRHSMNQGRLALERDGQRNLFGEAERQRRRDARRQSVAIGSSEASDDVMAHMAMTDALRNELRASVKAALDGEARIVDPVRIVSLLDSFETYTEKVSSTSSISIVDFTDK